MQVGVSTTKGSITTNFELNPESKPSKPNSPCNINEGQLLNPKFTDPKPPAVQTRGISINSVNIFGYWNNQSPLVTIPKTNHRQKTIALSRIKKIGILFSGVSICFIFFMLATISKSIWDLPATVHIVCCHFFGHFRSENYSSISHGFFSTSKVLPMKYLSSHLSSMAIAPCP